MKFCQNCGHQNKTEAKFCAQCGTVLEALEVTATAIDLTSESGTLLTISNVPPALEPEAMEAPVYQPAPAKKKSRKQPKQAAPEPRKKKGLLWLGVVLVVILLAVGGLLGLYLLVGRPLVQGEITNLLDDAIDAAEVQLEYSSRVHTEVVTQEMLDDSLDEMDLSSNLYSLNSVLFEQDQITVNLEFFSALKATYAFDIRVNDKGELIVNKLEVPKWNFLVFQKDYMQGWIEDSLNRLIKDSTIEFKAIQVTDGEFYFVGENN